MSINLLLHSRFTWRALQTITGFSETTLRRWLVYGKKPKDQNQEKFEKLLEIMKDNPLIEKHPSYGYATPEQIDRLKEIGICPERDAIMSDIEKQNRLKGRSDNPIWRGAWK